MKVLIVVLGLALLALAAACGGEPAPGPPESSGIQGQVLLGPQCPVIREGSPCPDQPLQATIEVYSADRQKKITSFTSGADGRFQAGLLPGDYYINPLPPNPGRPLPAGRPQTVTVADHKWTQIAIQYDTGIR